MAHSLRALTPQPSPGRSPREAWSRAEPSGLGAVQCVLCCVNAFLWAIYFCHIQLCKKGT